MFHRRETEDELGIVVAEVPAKPHWCQLRKVVFSWTKTKFAFHIRSAKTLKVNQREDHAVVFPDCN
jgi:hypothetical protein